MKPSYFAVSALLALVSIAAATPAVLAQSDTPAPEQPAQNVQPAPPANPGRIPVTSTTSPDLQALQKVEDSWTSALNKRDQYALELVLSPLYVDLSSTGEITTRDQQVANLINPGENKEPTTTTLRVVTVRMLGDVAVANGTYTFTHKVNSNMVEEKGVFTHVFQRLHGNWVCINSQRTALREDPSSAKAKSKEKSKAELPFHIPLFSKGEKSTTPNQ